MAAILEAKQKEFGTDIYLISDEPYRELAYDGVEIPYLTKYYANTMQYYYDTKKIHSAHLYQMYAYVKNMDKSHLGNISGLLLYAKTEGEIVPDCEFFIDGNKIGVKILDLNVPFLQIRKQLDEIIEKWW